MNSMSENKDSSRFNEVSKEGDLRILDLTLMYVYEHVFYVYIYTYISHIYTHICMY
jgi:hypothetical protein